jgi:hypothetical protein
LRTAILDQTVRWICLVPEKIEGPVLDRVQKGIRRRLRRCSGHRNKEENKHE